MTNYIDAEKLKAEIERQQRRLTLLTNTEQVSVRRDCALQNGAYSYILDIIDSLQQEQQEVDLEREIERVVENHNRLAKGSKVMKPSGIEKIARHFYELGLNARKEE